MNLATQITIVRILLIPVFIGLVIYYGESARGEHPNEALRLWAAAVFGIASLSDALDGWIARRFNQRTAGRCSIQRKIIGNHRHPIGSAK